MVIIISLKKLTTQQRLEIRRHYSLIKFDATHHQNKGLNQIGSADVIWFDLIPSMLLNLKNNHTYQYLLRNIDQLIKPTVVIVYDKEKFKNLVKPFQKITNFFLEKFPRLEHKNLNDILCELDKKKPKNLLIESPTEVEDNSDVDFQELHELFNSLQKKYQRLKVLFDKEKTKNKNLRDNISSQSVEIKTLREQVSVLKKPLKKPELKRETTSSEAEAEKITITDEKHSLVVKSNIRGNLENQSYRSRRDRNKKIQQLRKKYHTKT